MQLVLNKGLRTLSTPEVMQLLSQLGLGRFVAELEKERVSVFCAIIEVLVHAEQTNACMVTGERQGPA